MGGETKCSEGWYVKSNIGAEQHESCLSDPLSSPLTASEASSDVEVGALINIHEDDNQPVQPAEPNLTNNHSKQAKRVNRMLKKVDKDLARIKERESSRSVSPDRSKSSVHLSSVSPTVSLSLSSSPSPSMSNDRKDYFVGRLGQLRTNTNVIHTDKHANKNNLCSKGGLCCIGLIVLAVIIICVIGYHFDHSRIFLSHPEDIHYSNHSQYVKEAIEG